jgi:hypothetical protein
MNDITRKQRVLEVNPLSPLTEGLLTRVKAFPSPEDLEDLDPDAGAKLDDVASVLIDGALVRSVFEITDSNVYVLLIFACALCANYAELIASGKASTVLSAVPLVCLRHPKHPQTWSPHRL